MIVVLFLISLASPEISFRLQPPLQDFVGHINPHIDSCVIRHDRMYFRDDATQKIHIYSSDGSHLKSILTKGSGPGEIEEISSFDVGEQNIIVVDGQNPGRYTLFDLDGGYQKTVRLPPGEIIEYGTTPKILRKNLIHASHWGHRINGQRIVVRELSTGKVLKGYDDPAKAVSQRAGWLIPQRFQGEMWVPDPYERKIDVFNPKNGIVRTIAIPYGSEEDFNREKFEELVQKGKGLDAAKYYDNTCRLRWFFWVNSKGIITFEQGNDTYPQLGFYDHEGKLHRRTSLGDYLKEGALGLPVGIYDGMIVFLQESLNEEPPKISLVQIKDLL